MPGGVIPEEMLRFGVEFSDGRKATNTSGHPAFMDRDGEPAGPILMPGSGGGGRGSWRLSLWIWPLPPRGPLAFVCEWPEAEVPLTRREVDAEIVLEAAQRSQRLFAEREPGHAPSRGVGWTSYGPRAI
jgi:hypothetical protein